jgi:hypothetical protein
LGGTQKRSILYDMIRDHNIEIIAIQEIKKKIFTKRMLIAINPKFDNWLYKPSVEASGGILFWCDSSKFQIDSYLEK